MILLTFRAKNGIIDAKKQSFLTKNLTFGADKMYKMSNAQKSLFTMFDLSKFDINNSNNRWVILSKIIPWEKLEKKYANNFKFKKGRLAKPFRVALGSLIIKERMNLSDEETVNQIMENPFLQYFLGFNTFQYEKPFDSSLMTHFRKRLNQDLINEVNGILIDDEVKKSLKSKDDDENNDDKPDNSGGSSSDSEEKSTLKNKGELMLDATCCPSDIRFPTDVSLLNEALEKVHKMLDICHSISEEGIKKLRTDRGKLRKVFLNISKAKRNSKKKIRKAIKIQLPYLKRAIKKIKETYECIGLKEKHLKELEVIEKIYKQQLEMYKENKKSVKDRIISISKSFIRPIQRGKAKASTEFGAKLEVMLINGFSYVNNLLWDNYNEGTYLIDSLERYKDKFGFYPEAVLVDRLYRNKANISYCKERGIRLSGPRLGRPTEESKREDRELAYEDSCKRNAVEGAFGVCKRKYGMNKIMSKLKETSETEISLQVLVMNLGTLLRGVFLQFFMLFPKQEKKEMKSALIPIIMLFIINIMKQN